MFFSIAPPLANVWSYYIIVGKCMKRHTLSSLSPEVCTGHIGLRYVRRSQRDRCEKDHQRRDHSRELANERRNLYDSTVYCGLIGLIRYWSMIVLLNIVLALALRDLRVRVRSIVGWGGGGSPVWVQDGVVLQTLLFVLFDSSFDRHVCCRCCCSSLV